MNWYSDFYLHILIVDGVELFPLIHTCVRTYTLTCVHANYYCFLLYLKKFSHFNKIFTIEVFVFFTHGKTEKAYDILLSPTVLQRQLTEPIDIK